MVTVTQSPPEHHLSKDKGQTTTLGKHQKAIDTCQKAIDTCQKAIDTCQKAFAQHQETTIVYKSVATGWFATLF
ncbi:MAG: hypothetical protein LBK06_09855 [Planctomycetaceae bacterium]|jgi:hypothetical protein|nr:hypothetical protein [Planctomycetaceae bacterium]